MNKEDYMLVALQEAKEAYKEDEVPIGCVIVKDGEIIAKAHNHKEQKQDPTCHAEMECIRAAVRKLGNWHLDDCALYVTLEPCIMCAGSIINARIKEVYYGAADPKGGAFGSNMDITLVKRLNHYPYYEGQLLQAECSAILKDFFRNKRNNKNKKDEGQ